MSFAVRSVFSCTLGAPTPIVHPLSTWLINSISPSLQLTAQWADSNQQDPLVAWLRPPQSEAEVVDRQTGLQRPVRKNSLRASAKNWFDEAAIHPVRLLVRFIRTQPVSPSLPLMYHKGFYFNLIALKALWVHWFVIHQSVTARYSRSIEALNQESRKDFLVS
jgi:hypothetical protein